MIVRTASKMKNKIPGLLMEVGAIYDKRKEGLKKRPKEIVHFSGPRHQV